jgi:hypothetical protein
MSFLVFITDNETIEKSRKALFATSALLLFFASLTLRGDELDFFGLKVAVSQDRMIFIGQICVAFVLFRFSSLVLTSLLDLAHKKLTSVDENWEKKTVAEFPDFDNLDNDGYEQEPEDWEIAYAVGKRDREKRRGWVSSSRQALESVFGFAFNLLIPIAVGTVCVVDPRILDRLLDHLVAAN